jgi:hypothetical protein
MLQTGDDTDRFDPSNGAEITGYVNDVKVGGIETCNCHARAAGFRDTHIELVPGPDDSGPTRRVIVEVTPRIRAQEKQAGVVWTTSALKQKIVGQWVKVRGWLLFDQEHTAEAENTNPGNYKNWRATCWEIHPVFQIQVLPGKP